MSECYLFASGKGGVGKSTLAANLAVLLARSGRTVTLIDADLGLRSQDLLLGLENQVVYDLMDVARGKCLLSQALLTLPDLPSLRLLPAAQFVRCRDLDPGRLKKMIALLRRDSDFIFLDCPAGLERGLRNVLNAGKNLYTLVVVTPDDLCVRDAERVIALSADKKLPAPKLLVNRLRNDLIHRGEMMSAQTVSDVLDVPLLGEIPEDDAFCLSQLRHKLVVDYDCEARKAFTRIAARMQGGDEAFPAYGRKRPSLLRTWLHPVPQEGKK